MSTLEERLRSLQQARAMLEAIARDATLDWHVRAIAFEAWTAYPAEADVPRMLQEADLDKVQVWGRALAQARWVMQRVPIALGCDHPMSRRAAVVARHFPEAWYLPTLDVSKSEPWKAVFLDPMSPLRD